MLADLLAEARQAEKRLASRYDTMPTPADRRRRIARFHCAAEPSPQA